MGRGQSAEAAKASVEVSTAAWTAGEVKAVEGMASVK